jgi:hypothetical protein
MENLYYKLVGYIPVAVEDVLDWANSESFGTQVAISELGLITVSTIFIGTNVSLRNPPLVFETKILGGQLNGRSVFRYSTWEQAELGHQEICNQLNNHG